MRFSFNMAKALRVFAIACISAMLVVNSFAQTGTSVVSGTIKDAQGNVVPGATVTLLSAQGTSRTATTNSAGVYTFPSLQPGTYRVEVEAQGFKKALVSEFQALTDLSTEINVALEVGQVTETVNVQATSLESVVNTQDASLGNNFVSQQILQLPLEGRNVASLLSLQAGVTPDGSVTGGRSDQANITLDGIDVNNQQDASAFSPVIRINPDSVDEFRVTTANPDASKGRSSGAQVSLITKSGSNTWTGALYNYHRNTVTTANNWFNNANGVFSPTDALVVAGQARAGDMRNPRPQLIRNLFGGRVSGPIVKDRLFFFYNYEGLREAKSVPVTRTVPLPSLAAGNIQFLDTGCVNNTTTGATCAPGTQTPQWWTINTATINTFLLNGASPVVDVNPAVTSLFQSVVQRYPANDPTVGDGRNTSGFRFNAPAPVEQNAHTARFDWMLTSDQSHQISVRGNYQQDLTGGLPYFPDTRPTSTWSHPLGFSATHTWLINSNLTNRFSYGLTRLAFSNQGDSSDPAISFRYVFQPTGFTRPFERTNPTTNITDDLTWINGNHTFQFGTNIRLIKNSRVSYGKSFDSGSTNPSAHASNVARTVIAQYIRGASGDTPGTLRTVSSAWDVPAQGALIALFGRLSQYGANFNFDRDGSILGAGEGLERTFKTEEYDFYFQDSWKVRPNITLTYGLRYGLSMPVTETNGYETVPSIVLSDYLDRRINAMSNGQNYDEVLSVRLAGKANGLDSVYPLDKDNWQPRISIAWSPEYNKGFLGSLFGSGTESVIRAGFSITNDYFGQQLATNWDGANTLGFSTSSNINVNTYNITTNPAPLYTGPNMSIRNLQNIVVPGALTFPQTAPVLPPGLGKIETSLDQNLVSPINYSWNVSYGRRLPGKIWLDAAYVGRMARNLLAGRDIMMLANPRDPVSGQTWRQATQILSALQQQGVDPFTVGPQPFFENMWAPGSIDAAIIGAGLTNTQAAMFLSQPDVLGDWTYTMSYISDFGLPNYFHQGQYDALSAFGTIGKSDYHGGTLSLRQRFTGLTWDFNYTFSKSMDDSSGLQTGGLFGSAFITDSLDIEASRSRSDFDIKHLINFNGIWDVPIGKGKFVGGDMPGWLDAVIGGWQLSGVARYDSGRPFVGYFDGTGWQTNWQIRSYMTQLNPVSTGSYTATAASTCTSGCTLPNLFSDPNAAWNSFRTPYSGETGTRNPFNYPPSIQFDAGLSKSFKMPWREGHKVTIRWDTFNVTNSPVFTGQAVSLIGYTGSSPSGSFGRYTGTRNDPRIMQFAFRYDF